MKTYRYRSRISLDDLELCAAPDPEPGPNEVLLRVDAAALNYRDLAIVNGTYPGLHAPLVPGSDAAGTVLAVGPGVTRFRVGDAASPVYVPGWIDGPPRPEWTRGRLGGPLDGVLAERVVVHEEALVHVPKGWSQIEAATLPVAGVSAWHALVVDGGVRPGDDVVVRGTGAASLFLARIALAAGARPIVIGRDGARLERFRALGARGIDALEDPAWDERIVAMTGGRGADVLVDAVGGEELARSIAATRAGGTVVLYGFTAGTRAPIDLVAAIRRSVTLRATSGGSRESFERLVRAVEATHVIEASVDRVFPFEDLHAAFEHLAKGRPFGKVVVRGAEVSR